MASEEKLTKYAAGIDKALRRAARQAAVTAALTGTRLVIYEKEKIKHLRPRVRINTFKTVRHQYLRDREAGRENSG